MPPKESDGLVLSDPVIAANTSGGKYENCIPVSVDVATAMSSTEREATWVKIYKAIGVGTDEKSTRSVRCAVYVYCALNGTSSVGGYTGNIQTGSGKMFQARVIPEAAGNSNIRRFLRSCAKESVEFFKATGVLRDNQVMSARCESLGLEPSVAIALCDWLDDATGLTPTERQAQMVVKSYSLQRARGSRGDSNEAAEKVRRNALIGQGAIEDTHIPAATGGGW